MYLQSVFLTIGFLTLSWFYLKDNKYIHRRVAVLAIAMTALNWRTMILATSIFSEMLFAFLSVAALYVAERYEKKSIRSPLGLALGALMGLTFLTRSSGIALLAATGLYFIFRRRWRHALVPFAIASSFVIGWLIWTYVNRSTSPSGNAAYYTSYLQDLNSILGGVGESTVGSKLGALVSIIVQNLVGAVVVSVPIVCLGLNYESVASLSGIALGLGIGIILFFFLIIVAGFVRHSRKGFRLLHWYVISYLGLHLLWPYASYDRFLMCILPFLLVFLIEQFEPPLLLIKRQESSRKTIAEGIGKAFIVIVMLLCVLMVLYNYGSGISRTHAALGPAAEHAAEDSRLMKWITEHSDLDDVLICYRDPKYYLYTGRKAISFSWPKPRVSWEGQQSLIQRIVSESKGRYLILTSSDFNHDYDEQLQRESLRELIDQDAKMFVRVYETEPNGVIYRIEGTE